MIIDSRNEFCDATALNTGAAGTYLLGSQIDLGTGDKPIGAMDELFLVAVVNTTATSGGSATLQLKLASDATAAVATDGSATEHLASPVFPVASLVAGTVLFTTKMPQGFNYERFLGVLQVTGAAAFTAGKVDVFLTPDPARWAAYDSPSHI